MSRKQRHTEQRAEIGRRLREWRQKRDRSQADVARDAGTAQASLSNYETGKRDLPISTLLGVSRALDVGIGELLDIPEIVVVRDSRLGRAVGRLVLEPGLAETVAPHETSVAAS